MAFTRHRPKPDADARPDPSSAEELRSAAAAAEPDAFVSYAREDDEAAAALADGLRAAGKSVWMDREKIPYASDWRARARAGIDASKAVVLVLSPSWRSSDPCRYELDYAVERQKRLVPVTVSEALLPEHLPPALRDVVWIPAARGDPDAAVHTIVATLEDDLEWRDMHARLLVRALEWDERDRDRSLLLRGTDLRDGERWLTAPGRHGEVATAMHSAYLVASRREATRRQRIATGLVAGALLVSLGLAALAYWQRGVAVDNEREAVAQRRVAVRNAHQARSRELAATATAQLDADPELALLLGVEAAKVAPTTQAEEVLRASLPRVSGTTALRHPGLQALAADTHGDRAITGGTDGLGRLWDPGTGRRIAVLRGHARQQQTDIAQGVLSVAISPGGALAATGGAEGDVRVWDARTGKLQFTLRGPAGGPSDFGVQVGFVGERILVTAGASGVIRTWDASTGRPRGVVRLLGQQVTELAVSPDGWRIAIAALPSLEGQGLVGVWDARTLAPLARVRQMAFRVVLGPGGRRLATTALTGGRVRILDAQTGRLERAFAGAATGGAVAFGPDGRTAALAELGGRVGIVDLDTGAQRLSLPQPGTTNAITFSPDGTRLLTAGSDRTARLWDLADGGLLKALRGHRSGVWHASFLGGGTRVLTAGADGAARVWRPALAPESRELRGHTAVVDDVAVTPDGRRAVSISEDGTARVWELRTGRTVAVIRHHAGDGAPTVAVSRDGSRLLTSGYGPPRLWDATTGRALGVLPARGDGPAVFTPDGSLVVSATGMVWDVRRGRRAGSVPQALAGPVVGRWGGRSVILESRRGGSAAVAALPSGTPRTRLHGRFSSPYLGGAFTRDGTVLATEDDTRTELWDTRSGRRLGTLPGANTLPSPDAFSPTGEWLLTRTGTGVRVWDATRRRPVADLPHPRPVGSAVFSPNGRLVITASYDGLARVWEARTGRLVARLPGRRDQVWNEGFVPHALFAPDGRRVVAATGGTGVFVGDCATCAPLAGLLAQAEQATSRTLTADERHTYLGE